MTTENVQKQTDDFLAKALKSYETLLPQMKEGEAKKLAKDGFLIVKTEIERRAQQKKSESQPTGKTGQLEQKKEFFQKQADEFREAGRNDLAEKVEQEVQNMHLDQEEIAKAFRGKTKAEKWEEVREKLPAMARAYDETIKTVKAPAFVSPGELINVELEDSKGNKQVKTFSKAQVRALARKYFSNVHESWLGKERKMGVGFKNLLAYAVAWKEFDGALPVLRDVLPDYDRYNKGCEGKEASETFKVAQELYDKIVQILTA